jgi:hypothetical protein
VASTDTPATPRLALDLGRSGFVGIVGGTADESATLYDLAGRAIERANGGETGTRWIGPLRNGVYFCRLQSRSGTESRKVIVVK